MLKSDLTITYTKSYFSGYHSYYWGAVNESSIIIDDSGNNSQEKRQEVPTDLIDLSSFSFLDIKSDTVIIHSEKPFIFIETWNENCYPCKIAIKELIPVLDSMNNKIESYFIYENKKFDRNVFVQSTMNIKELSSQNVLADYNQEFFTSMKMTAYPTFFMIDNEKGKIIYMSIGYGGKSSREMWIKKLKEISKM